MQENHTIPGYNERVYPSFRENKGGFRIAQQLKGNHALRRYTTKLIFQNLHCALYQHHRPSYPTDHGTPLKGGGGGKLWLVCVRWGGSLTHQQEVSNGWKLLLLHPPLVPQMKGLRHTI